MRILITGSRGFIGSSLVNYLEGLGHQVLRLMRYRPVIRSEQEVYWDPQSSASLDPTNLKNLDVVIHLAGSPIADRAWTEDYKRELWESRVKNTENLIQALSSLTPPPKLFLCASAIGIYGNRAIQALTENSPAGVGFLADLCKSWEEATKSSKMRVVNLRFGHVLDENGGILKEILPIFRNFLGGKLGNGEQYMSWVSLIDLRSIVKFIIENENIYGPVNIVAPNPVTNAEFTRILAKTLHRPAFFSLPAPILKVIFGKEKANELFLSSCRAIPEKLLLNGFQFKHENLEEALEAILA